MLEDGDGYRFYFELPGLKADAVDVRVDDGQLVIEAERKRPEWPKDATLHRAERYWGKLRRAFVLPDDAASDNVRASYKDGILDVSVPKTLAAKPVKIEVAYAA